MYQNNLLLKALAREKVSHTPIWVMRQAGRYLPEYRKIREKVRDFGQLTKNPELATIITLQPIKRYPLDAAILFSDILVIPESMGMQLHFVENIGPQFVNRIQNIKQIENLEIEEDLAYVLTSIKYIKRELKNTLPLIGFAGSPLTLAAYMIEGGSSKDFALFKKFLYQEPENLHKLLSKLAVAVKNFLLAQIAAGVDVVMLFDTWGGILTSEQYLNFSLHYMQNILQDIKAPSIIFSKFAHQHLEKMLEINCSAISIDWTCDLANAKKRVGDKVALQGNLDPTVLLADGSSVKKEAQKILEQYGARTGHIFNLGHGILPEVNPDNLAILIDTVHNYSYSIHNSN